MTASKTSGAPKTHLFHHDGIDIAACEWGDPDGTPVLATHGWLDNAASFAVVGPLLKGVRLVAVDLAGHGLSSHRAAHGTYNIWQDVGDIHAVANQLGWERFALLGHSRGGMICTLTAGTFPERISHLALLDSFVPQTMMASEAPLQLAKAIEKRPKVLARSGKIYATIAQAEAARTRGESPLTPAAAHLIVGRAIQSVTGGFRWRSDEKLKIPSEVKLTEDMVEAFVTRINCPVLMLLAHQGRLQRFYGMEKILKNLTSEIIAGGHHFHMEESAGLVAERLSGFFAKQP